MPTPVSDTLVPYTDPQALLKGAGTGKLKPKS